VTPHEVERDRAAEGVAEEVDPRGPVRETLERRDHHVREEPDPVVNSGARRLVGVAVPEEVGGEDAPPAREERRRERPFALVGPDAVEENEGRQRSPGRRAERPEVQPGHVNSVWKPHATKSHTRILPAHEANPPCRSAVNLPLVRYRSFQYQAASWVRPRRVIAKVEHHLGELFSRVGRGPSCSRWPGAP